MTDPRHMGARCHRCDRPQATQAAWDEIPDGGGDGLCWDATSCPAVDWRTRSLAAEEKLERLRAVVRQCEWVEQDDPDTIVRLDDGTIDRWRCPLCERVRSDGHAPDCELAAVIRESDV